MPQVAIVIPVFNGMPQLASCLESLRWAAATDGVDVVVADCGSTDGSREFVVAEHPWVHLVPGDPTMWWAAATNLGCRYARHRLLAEVFGLLNHDCRWSEESFAALLRAYRAAPGAIHCSRVVGSDGRLVLAGGGTARSGRLTMRGLDMAVDPGFPAGRVDWCGGRGVLLPASLWERLGDYDERALPHYHADADFCLRAARVGVPTLYCPSSTVVVDKTSTGLVVAREGATVRDVWRTLWDRKSSINIKETVRFYVRHRGPRAVLALAHVYSIHLGSSAFRVARRWRAGWAARRTERSGTAPRPVAGDAGQAPSDAGCGRQRPLRILMVTDVWPTEYSPGRGAFVRCAANALLERGHDVRVMELRRWFPNRQVAAAARRPRRLPDAVARWWRESCLARPLSPPPVVSVDFTAPPMALSHDRWGAWAMALAGPAIVRSACLCRPDVVHGHWVSPAGYVAVRLAKRLGVPAVVSVHGLDIAYTAAFRRRGARSVAAVLKAADAVVANSSPTARAVEAARGSADRVYVVWQGGDVVGGWRPAGDVPRVISVGHIASAKGFGQAAAALGRCRAAGARFSWRVVGRGGAEEESRFRAAVRCHGLEGLTTLAGELTNEQVLREMADADIFLLLTRRDAYGVVFAEAMGAGLAVVGSTAAGAVADFVAAGAPVVAVDPYDVEAVAAALLPLLTDREHLDERRRAARAWAAEHLGWDRCARQLEDIYRSVARGRAAAGS